MTKLIAIVGVVLVGLLLIVSGIGNHYYNKYVTTLLDLKTANATITTMQDQAKVAAELDAKYTKELSDAKSTIDSLRNDVASGRKRLLVHAKCVSNTTGTSSVGNADTAELEDSNRKDYYDLLRMMEQQRAQVLYLQEYIRNVINKE